MGETNRGRNLVAVWAIGNREGREGSSQNGEEEDWSLHLALGLKT